MTKVLKTIAALSIATLAFSVASLRGQAGSGPITIASVVGLSNELAIRPLMGIGYALNRTAVINASGQLDGAAGNLSDCVRVDGSSGPCGTGPGAPGSNFADSEVPHGAINGTNASFTLANAPSPVGSLHVYLNGIRLSSGADYSISGTTIIFPSPAVLQSGDLLVVDYRY